MIADHTPWSGLPEMLACVLLAAGEPSSVQLGRDSAGAILKRSEQILISKIERDRIHCSGDALLRELVPAASCAFVNVYTVWAQVGTFPATMRWSNRQFVVR